MANATADIRNVALVGSAGAGKTLLAEKLLHATQAIPQAGSIEENSTVSDFDPREHLAGYSMNPTVLSCEQDSKSIHLVDTPGSRDFFGRTVSVLPSVETSIAVIDASAGVEAYINTVMTYVEQLNQCRMVVINKIDRDGVEIDSVVDQVQSVLGKECLPINLPSVDMESVVDCFFEPGNEETAYDAVDAAHEKIIEQVVELDEELTELYLMEGIDAVPADQLHNTFERALREGHLIPICFTSALTGAGIDELLKIIVEVMPNPKEGNPPSFVNGVGEQVEELAVSADPEGHLLAHVFMVKVDPFKGKLAVCKVHQGELRTGSSVFVGHSRKALRIAHLLKLRGNEQIEVDTVTSGEICAIPRAEDVSYDAVLHDSHDEDEVHLRGVALPNPVFSRALETSDDKDAQKVSEGLNRLSAQDPSMKVEHVAASNETVLRCMGEIHLREILDHISSQHGVKVETQFPAVPYRETVTRKADGHHRHKKQSGGSGQFGEVFLSVEPLDRGAGFEFVDKVVGGVIPGQFIPAVEKGVRQVMETGSVSGNEMQDIRVTVYDGKHHSVDSKEIAFVQAGKFAFIDAVKKAKPVVMEPIVDLTVNVPAENMGDIAGDLSSMGGLINGSTIQADGTTEIVGQAPLREAQTYHSKLNSHTGGKGSYTMEFSHYEAVQAQLQAQLVNEYRPVEEE